MYFAFCSVTLSASTQNATILCGHVMVVFFSSLIRMSILLYIIDSFLVRTLGQLVRLLCTMLMSFTFSQVSWFQVSYFVEPNRAINYILYGDVENSARSLGVCRRIFG